MTLYDNADAALRIVESNHLKKAIKPIQLDSPKEGNILIFAPHQDDETIGCGYALSGPASLITILPPLSMLSFSDKTSVLPNPPEKLLMSMRKNGVLCSTRWVWLLGHDPANIIPNQDQNSRLGYNQVVFLLYSYFDTCL